MIAYTGYQCHDDNYFYWGGQRYEPGCPYSYADHEGIDWGVWNQPVYTAADGTVSVSELDNDGWGHYIVIDHENGYSTLYGHLSRRDVYVEDIVVSGQQIGVSGDTGVPDTPYHLHFSVFRGGYVYRTNETDPFGWQGDYPDPLLNWPGAAVPHTASCLWRGSPGSDLSCFDRIVEDDANEDPARAYWDEGTAYNYPWAHTKDGNGYWAQCTGNLESGEDTWGRWIAPILHHGYYAIMAFIPENPSNTPGPDGGCWQNRLVTENAQYDIRHYNGTVSDRAINQRNNGLSWVWLDTLELAPDHGHNVFLNDLTGEDNLSLWVLADSMKYSAETVFLPTIREDDATGRHTYIAVASVNPGSAPRTFTVNWYPHDGDAAISESFVMPQGRAMFTPDDGFDGSAVIVAPVPVVAAVFEGTDDEVTGYTGISDGNRDTGWGEPGPDIYVPVVVWHPPWKDDPLWESTIHIQNAGSGEATVDITYYDLNGAEQTQCGGQVLVSFRETLDVNPAACADPENGFTGSAYISSTQPIAVVVSQKDFNAGTHEGASRYNAFTYGATEIYLPSLVHDWSMGENTWYSSFTVQNVGSEPATIEVQYIEDDGSDSGGCTITNLAPHASRLILQEDPACEQLEEWHGSAILTSTSGQPIVAIVNQQLNDWPVPGDRVHQSYSGLMGGANVLFGPFAADEEYELDGFTYRSACEVQSLVEDTQVASAYFWPAGTDSQDPGGTTRDVFVGRTATYYIPGAIHPDPRLSGEGVTDNFGGSVRLQSADPRQWIAGINNIARWLCQGQQCQPHADHGASYNLPQRRDLPPSSRVGTLSTYYTGAIPVNWSGTDDFSGIVSYDVQYRDGSGGAWTGWLTATTATDETFEGQDGHNYYFRCRARDFIGNLEEWPPDYDVSTTVDLTDPSSEVADLPTYSPANVPLSWSGSDATSGVADYDVQVCQGECPPSQGIWSEWLGGTTATSASFTGEHGQTYHFRSRARDNAGNEESYPDGGDTWTIVDAQPPSTTIAPLDLYIFTTSFTVTWHGADDLSGLAHYDIYYRDESQANWVLWLEDVTITQSTFLGSPGHTYHFCSRGVDNVGNAENCPPACINGDQCGWPIQSDAQIGIAPWSRVNDLPPTTAQMTFQVCWSGIDGQLYNVYVRDGLYGSWTKWQKDAYPTCDFYTGSYGHVYYFYSVGMNEQVWEEPPYDWDAFTKLVSPTEGQGEVPGGGEGAFVLLFPDEAPDRMEDVTRTQSLGTPVEGYIAPTGDVDWYRFELTESMRLRIQLVDLPADYDLYVFDGSGRFRWASTWGRQLPEEVVVRVPAGVYYLRLDGYAGAWNGETPYWLLVAPAHGTP